MKAKRKIVEIDEERCTGCGQCVPACAEGAIQIVDGKARLVAEKYCDGLGACLGECPVDALKVIERESEEFDPEAVEQYLSQKAREEEQAHKEQHAQGGCPSARMQMFHTSCEEANRPRTQDRDDGSPALSQWPVQIALVPAKAPFLRGADLLVAADCTTVACRDFHRKFVSGKVLLMGCPKLDDAPAYVKKFTEIFREANIRSVTVLDMEVPCCSALPMIIKKGMAAAGKEIPMEEITIKIQGQVLKKDKSAA